MNNILSFDILTPNEVAMQISSLPLTLSGAFNLFVFRVLWESLNLRVLRIAEVRKNKASSSRRS